MEPRPLAGVVELLAFGLLAFGFAGSEPPLKNVPMLAMPPLQRPLFGARPGAGRFVTANTL